MLEGWTVDQQRRKTSTAVSRAVTGGNSRKLKGTDRLKNSA
jgi:hypothetical protein